MDDIHCMAQRAHLNRKRGGWHRPVTAHQRRRLAAIDPRAPAADIPSTLQTTPLTAAMV